MTTPALRTASYTRFYEMPPQLVEHAGARTWLARGANFVIAFSKVAAGAVLERADNPDEYMVFLLDVKCTIAAASESIEAGPDSLTIVPPGASRIAVQGEGSVVRVFSSRAADLAALAANRDAYAEGAPGVAPLVPWPAPPAGYKLRSYRVSEYTRPGSNMRVFRSTNLMLNLLVKRETPRDVRKLSPHSHADFEQGSLAIGGTYVHHCRYPWTPDMNAWREDEHVQMGNPSLMVVPPTVIHTSQNIGAEPGWLIDVFAPPRLDFSLKPGTVCNADEYPVPALPAGTPLPVGEAA
jgi:mannose-6-phosphate isomerase-like protein (cupin superfamily)